MRIYSAILILCVIFWGCKKSSTQGKQSQKLVAIKPDTGWQAVAPLPIKRTYATSFTIGNKGYLCGGVIDFTKSYGPDSKYMYMYDPVKNSWTQKAGLPPRYFSDTVRRSPFSFVIGNIAYAGGGISLNGNSENDIERYDAVNDVWTQVGQPGVPYHFDLSVATDFQNKGYILTSNDIQVFDPLTNTVTVTGFSYRLTFPTIDNWIGSNGVNLFYGSSGSYAYFLTIDPATNTFFGSSNGYYPSLPQPLIVASHGIFYKNCMYLCSHNAGHLYRYNFTIGQWQIVSLKDLGVTEGATTFLIGSKLYVAGGNNGIFSASTNQVYSIDLDAYP